MEKIKGSFLYKEKHTTHQVANIKSFFESLLIEENFDIIIEIGTSFGGLTYIIDDIIKENKLHHKVHTLDYSYKDYAEKELNERECSYHVMDERDDIFKNTVKDLMENYGKCLLLCDGGNKKEEFNRYSEFLKNGDMIMAHDYSLDRAVFENEIKNKIWNWWEISYNDIKESIDLYNLSEYKKIDFKNAAWACYQKS